MKTVTKNYKVIWTQYEEKFLENGSIKYPQDSGFQSKWSEINKGKVPPEIGKF